MRIAVAIALTLSICNLGLLLWQTYGDGRPVVPVHKVREEMPRERRMRKWIKMEDFDRQLEHSRYLQKRLEPKKREEIHIGPRGIR